MAAKQITVWGSNRPGNLARITGAVAAKGVNIRPAFETINLTALKAAGYRVTEDPSVALSLPDKPGQLARAAAKLSKARVNITYGYATVSRGAKRGTIVLGVSNAAAARRALR